MMIAKENKQKGQSLNDPAPTFLLDYYFGN